MHHKQRIPLSHAIARPALLDSHNGTRLHVIDSHYPATGLRQYRVKWKRKETSDEEGPPKKNQRPQFSMQSTPRSYEGPNCYGCNDATWLISGKKIACVSTDALSFLKTSGENFPN